MRPHDVEDEEPGAALGLKLRGFCQKIRPGGPKFHTIPLLKTLVSLLTKRFGSVTE